MIAVLSKSVLSSAPNWQPAFDAILPDIVRHARFALRPLPHHARDEALQDVLANCCLAFSRLAARGKADEAFPSTLVRFAVAQFKCGRRVGNRLRSGDVLSDQARRQNQFRLESLDAFDAVTGEWREALFEDRKTCVADQAAFRIDFPAWLAQLPPRDRLVAEALSLSYTTQEVSARFLLSPGRVSQMRGELQRSWLAFHGESADRATAPTR